MQKTLPTRALEVKQKHALAQKTLPLEDNNLWCYRKDTNISVDQSKDKKEYEATESK